MILDDRRTPLIGFALLLCAIGAASAQPYRPADDAEVLENLPGAAPRPASATLEPAMVAVQARAYIERARATGDPRFLGYAAGLLRPWWDEPVPPPELLLLRATLKQAHHDFAGALRDLETLLHREPGHAQAWLTRATVLRVQGRLPEALAACMELQGRADDFIVALCGNAVRGLSGQRAAAAAALEALADESRGYNAAVRAWYAAERADLAERAGDDARALRLYAGAIAAGADDPPLRAAFADLLLDLGRPEEALRIVGETSGAAPTADVLRLRQVLALRALERRDVALEAALADSFAAAHRRGEGAHLREETRFILDVLGDAQRALALARDNWEQQRQPIDARLLAAAALAARQPRAAEPVREFVRRTGLEDARLEKLLRVRP